jgi:hypothetical protein
MKSKWNNKIPIKFITPFNLLQQLKSNFNYEEQNHGTTTSTIILNTTKTSSTKTTTY